MKRTSLRLPIPLEMREQINIDPFFRNCLVLDDEHEGRIEINHAFSYGGKRQNVMWGFIGLCTKHHREQGKYRALQETAMRARILHFNARADFDRLYPKSDLFRGIL